MTVITEYALNNWFLNEGLLAGGVIGVEPSNIIQPYSVQFKSKQSNAIQQKSNQTKLIRPIPIYYILTNFNPTNSNTLLS